MKVKIFQLKHSFSQKLEGKDFSSESENEEIFLINLHSNDVNSSHRRNKIIVNTGHSPKMKKERKMKNLQKIEHYGKVLLILFLREDGSNIIS